jgi:hypothetical protein
MPMSAAFDRRRIVDAVAGHGHHVPLLLQGVGQQHFVLGRDAADDTDVVYAVQPLAL